MILDKIFFWRSLSERRKYRLLEMIPGLLTWLTFLAAFVLSFVRPLWVIVFIIVYAFLWLVRVVYFVVYLVLAWRKHRAEIKVDWFGQVKQKPNWQRLYHVVFLPTYKEPYEVLRTTFEALVNSTYPKDKVIVVLGGEERAAPEFLTRAKKLEAEFGQSFLKLLVTVHPKDVAGEIIGKGSNVNFMGRQFQKFADEQRLPYEDIIVSSFDCDTAVHPQYLARISHAYLTHSRPTRASYQPLALYNNNMWQSPSFTRVVANSTTFWLMTELARPEQFMTFSSHSMPWQALVDVGFWQKDIVTEDSRIFLQCFLKYEGEYELVPIYIPVSMDTVAAGSFWQTIKNQYKQMQRWAWSVEHQPYLITHFFRRPNRIPLLIKLRYMWKVMEGQYSWATGALLLFIFGRLPIAVASGQQSTAVLVQNAPFILQDLMLVAMIGIAASAIFNILLLPAKPPKYPYTKYLAMALQWLLLPVTIIVFGAFPAIDAQTRLLLGKYLGFWNTEKTRR